MADRTGKLSRRRFLKKAGGTAAGAGAALALPTIITGNALGGPSIAPASERVLIGAMGCRNRGGQNMKALMGRKDAQIIAVCDVDSKILAAAKTRAEKAGRGKCAAFGDYRKMLEMKDLDAIVISTPDHWHALATIDACDAGLDVYCEKPLTLFIEEGKAMIRAARKNRRVVQTGSQQRSDRRFRKACELVRSGYIGKVKEVRVGIAKVNYTGPPVPDSDPPPELDYDMWLGPAPWRPYNVNRVHYKFRFFWDYSGGQMTNWGAHHLDIAQWGLGMDKSGPVEAVATEVKYHPKGWYEVPMFSEVVYHYGDGVRMVCSMRERMGTTFIGEKGTIYVNRGKLESKPADIVKQTIKDNDVHLYQSDNHYGNWIACIKYRRMPICDVAIGHRSASVCHLGNIAIRTNRKVRWDPAKEQLVDPDPEQLKLVNKPYRKPWQLRYI